MLRCDIRRRMLTAVIRSAGSTEALAATFSVLIPAVADGFLGHAVVLDAVGDATVERLADATGASYLRADGSESWPAGAAGSGRSSTRRCSSNRSRRTETTWIAASATASTASW